MEHGASMKRIWEIAKCRILYGHIMVPYGDDRVDGSRTWVYYMCARCTLCQRLNVIGRDKEAE